MEQIFNTAHWVWIDYAIALIVVLSALIGLMRGFIKEAFALLSWGLAIFVGVKYNVDLAVLLQNTITIPSARMAAAFIILFFATLILASVIHFLLGEMINRTGLSGSDRLIGLLFGLVRGAAIIVIMIVLAGLTPLPEDPWWKQSQLIPPFQTLAVWAKAQIPSELAAYVNFH